jgi:hypothetical protein
MSAHSNLDREAFQMLLASAFAIQESGIGRQSLSVLGELHKSITKHELQYEGILALIADRARVVANATGIAIGILTSDHLVYRAGSGCAAGYVGRQVTAVLSLSAHSGARKEILRVENAETDARIEATICREREAKALLMIPIYRERVVAGVLEVLFRDPHTFDLREMRTYRLMAGLVEEAMLIDIQRSEKSAQATQPPTPAVSDSIEIPPQAVARVCGPTPTVTGAIPTMCPPHKDEKTIRWQAKPSLLRDPRWTVDAALVVIVLAVVAWISIHHRASPSIVGSPRLNASRPTPKPSATIFREGRGSTQKGPVATESMSRARSPFKRVRVGPNEVDYIAEDVTVRRFTTKVAIPHAHAVNKRFDIGDDVTVRIFTDAPAVAPKPRTLSRR